MTLAQKLKRLRELLRDSAVREELALTLPASMREYSPWATTDEDAEKSAEPLLTIVGDAIELAQENVAEAGVEKRMNRT